MTSHPTQFGHRDLRSIGALLWLFCFQFFVAEQIARMAWTIPYSMTRNAISDLGVLGCGPHICSPLHALMNGSFVLQGLLIVSGVVLARGSFPKGRLSTLALAAIALAGLGVLVVGLVPENVNRELHTAGAALNFFAGNIGMILAGVSMLRALRRPSTHAWLSIAAGAIGLLATLLLGFHNAPAWNRLNLASGAVERAAAYPLPLWLTGTGLLLLVRRCEGYAAVRARRSKPAANIPLS